MHCFKGSSWFILLNEMCPNLWCQLLFSIYNKSITKKNPCFISFILFQEVKASPLFTNLHHLSRPKAGNMIDTKNEDFPNLHKLKQNLMQCTSSNRYLTYSQSYRSWHKIRKHMRRKLIKETIHIKSQDLEGLALPIQKVCLKPSY